MRACGRAWALQPGAREKKLEGREKKPGRREKKPAGRKKKPGASEKKPAVKEKQRFRKPWLLVTTLLMAGCATQVNGEVTEVSVQLSAPRWVPRGGSATLRCLHQVPPQLLYKVEFLRTGGKLLQYVRERIPPYTNYTVPGARLNMSLSSESSVTLQNVEFSASAMYWCEVSLDTPIYTAASPAHQLTVVHPQKHPPIITFGSPDVVVGGMLRANCTSAPASPPPHLTWYIDGVKVEDTSVRYYSYRVSSSYRSAGRWRKHHHRNLVPGGGAGGGGEGEHLRHRPAPHDTTVQPPATPSPLNSTTKNNIKCTLKDAPNEDLRTPPRLQPPAPTPAPLTVTVSELHAPAHGKLQLTCVATIPDQVAPGEHFADMKKQTVTVAVNELHPKKSAPEATQANRAGFGRDSTCLLLIAAVAVTAISLIRHPDVLP